MSEETNTTDEVIDCTECLGDGTSTEMDCQSGTASNCCGGCYKTVACDTCEGSGEIENEDYDYNLN